MREHPTSYLQTFTDFKMAESRFFAARRVAREHQAAGRKVGTEFETAQQAYREAGAKLVLVADRIGIKPLGGFAPSMPIGVG
jgi:hypothetical protein